MNQLLPSLSVLASSAVSMRLLVGLARMFAAASDAGPGSCRRPPLIAYSSQREGLGAYPFFTLPEREPALLAEFRGLVEAFEDGRGTDHPPFSFGELILAGPGGPEVAFVLRWDCLPEVCRLTRQGSDGLRLHFGGWYGGPKTDLLPAGLDVPRDAFPSLGFEFTQPGRGPFSAPSEDFVNLWTVLSHPDGRVGQVWQSRDGVFHAETPDGLKGEAAFVELCSWPQVSCSQTTIWLGSEDSRGLPARTIFRSPAEFLPAGLQVAAE